MSSELRFTHYWRLRCRLLERYKTPCRVLARGKLNSVMVQFADGVSYIVSRYAVRKLSAIPRDEAQCVECGLIKKMYLLVYYDNRWICPACDPNCQPVDHK